MKYADLPGYLVEAPLYRAEPLEEIPWGRAVIEETDEGRPRPTQEMPVPKDLRRHCSICEGVQNWRWSGIPGSAEWIHMGLNLIGYRCRNCGDATFSVWILVWRSDGGVFVQKVGQWPKLEITLPADFEKALGKKNKYLYIRGMASRH